MQNRNVPKATLQRYPVYLKALRKLQKNGVERIMSKELSSFVDIEPTTIRRDFSFLGNLGKQGYGYDVDKLRLGICLTTSDWANILYNKTEMYEKFDTMLKEVDEEYRTTLINFAKYKLVMFTMAKIMEMEQIQRNKVILFLFNSVK